MKTEWEHSLLQLPFYAFFYNVVVNCYLFAVLPMEDISVCTMAIMDMKRLFS